MSESILPQLERAFAADRPATIGIEEELILLEPDTLEPAAAASQLLDRLADPATFKPELPAAQLEIVTTPVARVADAISEIAAARARLERAAGGLLAAAIPVHPFSGRRAVLSEGPRYERLAETYGQIAELQLVGSLHIHVCAGGAERSVAVYTALRNHLPELLALAANGPFHGGADTGLATVRPKIAELLPRQGVPPAFGSLADYAAALDWLVSSGSAPEAGWWWYELRLHPGLGTVEVRVADAQTTLTDAGAIAALVHCLAADAAARFEAGEPERAAPTERIEANRFSAARDGIEGTMADLSGGKREPTRERIATLIERVGPFAGELRCEGELAAARELLRENGAMRQRRLARESGGDLRLLTLELARAFSAPAPAGLTTTPAG